MNLLHIPIKASLQAGKAILEVYNSDFEVEAKDDNSPLTLADQKANTIINGFLIDTEIPIISEENKQIDYEDRKNWERCWIVDPLDGTKEFVKRNGEFTVNIALVEQGKPVLGVIYVPVEKTLYFGDVSEGKSYKAILSSDHCDIEEVFNNAIEIYPKSAVDKRVRVVGSRSHLNDATRDFISEIEENNNEVEIVSKGSSLKFCLVAEGKADVYPRFAPTMEWDTAAGQAICNAVGIKVIDQTTQNQLAYNKENLLNPYFLVKK